MEAADEVQESMYMYYQNCLQMEYKVFYGYMTLLLVQSGYSTSYGVQSGDSSQDLNKDM